MPMTIYNAFWVLITTDRLHNLLMTIEWDLLCLSHTWEDIIGFTYSLDSDKAWKDTSYMVYTDREADPNNIFRIDFRRSNKDLISDVQAWLGLTKFKPEP
jgi:hypothetical protein